MILTPLIMQIMIKEEDRLSTTIEALDYDVRIVPRGAYCRTALGTVGVNRSFEGKCLRLTAPLC